jgi:hypothetical protein
MKGGTRAAVAIAVGYVLGRRRKMRLATLLAAGAATGGIAGIGGAAVRRGTKALGSPEVLGKLGPQFGQMAETVGGDLVEAGKAAAVAAVTGRIDSLADSLHERAESIRNPVAAASEDDADDEDWAGEDEAGEDHPAMRRRTPRDPAPVSRARR